MTEPASPSSPQAPLHRDAIAAVDLGSNSFHMVIARVDEQGQMTIIDRIKDTVRLGGGLDEQSLLTPEAQQRALETLARFGERVRHMPEGSVRIVGTNTLRKARNARGFLIEAQRVLGHPIEIVSGREEARLVYQGVARGVVDDSEENRLVIDIGGGSTEVIIGHQLNVLACESLYMGCVSFSQTYFEDGKISAARFERAVIAARQELRAIEHTYPEIGWDCCFGSSGTAKAVQDIVLAEKIGTFGITMQDLLAIRQRVLAVDHVSKLKLSGLKDERAPVLPGGLAVLIGLFQSLKIERMRVSDMALREGVLFELYGRLHDEDIRDRTISHMASRYQVDLEHARRVERAALSLFDQVAEPWELGPWMRKRLSWACHIHEIGLTIAHSRYHKHGSYLVENSEMPGFSRRDQQLLWALVRTHRRSFKPHRFASMPDDLPFKTQCLCVLLRLAVVLTRARTEDAVPQVTLEVGKKPSKLKLTFPEQWLERSPLMSADLANEAKEQRAAGFELKYT